MVFLILLNSIRLGQNEEKLTFLQYSVRRVLFVLIDKLTILNRSKLKYHRLQKHIDIQLPAFGKLGQTGN